MKTTEKIDYYSGLIKNIDYNSREGGKYAYVLFLSITREVLFLLQPVKQMEAHVKAIESINWIFNDYLGSRFSEHQRVIFDLKRKELLDILETLKKAPEMWHTMKEESIYHGLSQVAEFNRTS